MAERMGQPLMPWQQMVADVGGEIDPGTGLPAYRSVVVTVERQCGKTQLVLAWNIQRAHGWGSPQRMVYSAQTGLDARKKLVEDWAPILEPRKAKLGIRRILKANGSEAVEFRNGSRIVLMGSGDDAGHGKTVDLAVKDEFFADYDNRRDQALVPAMATRSEAQVLTLSTAGTDASVPLRQAVERGRAAVEAAQRDGIAYFEWSAPDEADIDDPAVWWAHIPALGYTITEEVVRQARAELSEGEFRRAFLNQWTKTEDRLIPATVWDLVNDPDHKPTGTLSFGLDVNPERSAAAIAAADGTALEIVEHRATVRWAVDRAVELQAKWGGVFAIDAAGPAAALIPELEAKGVQVSTVAGREMNAACGDLFDAITESQVRVRRHASLDTAVAGARKRVSGDAWSWARKHGVDICPLMAATLAHWTASHAATADFYVI